jgi:putative membrane protein
MYLFCASWEKAMNAVTQFFVIVTGVVHAWAWLMESVLWRKPAVQRMMLHHEDSSDGVRLWAFNQGFYNLFFALGAVGGVIAYRLGHHAAGTAVALFTCASMAIAGLVLWVSDHSLWKGAIGQSSAPLAALIVAWIATTS